MIINLNSAKGSILLEALLSVIILSFSITIIIQAMTSSLRGTVFSTDYTQAMILLDNAMIAMLQNGPSAFEDGELSTRSPFDKYAYSVSVEPVSLTGPEPVAEGEDGSKELNLVSLNVSWQSGRRENRVRAQTLLFEVD